ncbi:hypothetical protein LET1_00007 [Pectobacterium phage LET1]|nr:hypothetical protein LET1_00007 [Pectobacterium phage LET1]
MALQFAHKLSSVDGGNKLVTVTQHNGKALVKVTHIPTKLAKSYNIGFKDFVKLVESSHEKYLYDVARSIDVSRSVLRGETE